ncbi:multicopper oxidase family protein [Microvirga thermotolerans]|uniref:Multicopper oxidase domain-containing protein n=1 Tax=Microvirga thermotolerans TaxID=2651334 RepID=A0A5P9JVY9_9HYPH|nr:multicopper oxidase family protein [Microvirga thermotolerans]QFU16379.1 multicopper oxidase domain-containing protein [Microvirga thermotolerans]
MITRRAATAGLATLLFGLGRRSGTAAPGASDPWLPLPGELVAAPGRRRLRPDAAAEAEILTLGDRLHPAFRLKAGAPLAFTFRNGTALPLSLHVQGMRGLNGMDGVGGLTQPPVAPGETFTYRQTPPDPGTLLIRPCVLGRSAEPLERGLSALLVVEEPAPPPVDLDVPLLIDDWSLGEDGALAPFPADAGPNPGGRLGNLLTVNGAPAPWRVEAPPGGRVRLRLANACNARAFRLRFDGLKATVIAVDGQPTDTFEPLRASLPLAPGSRYDLLVDLPAGAAETGRVVALVGNGFPLAEIAAAGDPGPARPAPSPLAPNGKLPSAIALEKAARKDVLIQGEDGKPAPWTLNGAAGDAAAPLLKVRRGSPVVLTLINRTPLVQPFHLHGHVFRLLHALDDGWQPYFLDTVQVPENKTVRIAFVADNPGRWLLASTAMERFDAGLWTWIEVS